MPDLYVLHICMSVPVTCRGYKLNLASTEL